MEMPNQQEQQQPQPQGLPPARGGNPEQGQEQQPEQRRAAEIYRGIRTAAMKKIYGDKAVTQQIVQRLQAGGQDPVTAVCEVALMVLDQVREGITGIPKEMAYVAVPSVIAELGALGTAAGVFRFTPQMFQQAIAGMQEKLAARMQQPGGPTAQPEAPVPQAPQPQALLESEV